MMSDGSKSTDVYLVFENLKDESRFLDTGSCHGVFCDRLFSPCFNDV